MGAETSQFMYGIGLKGYEVSEAPGGGELEVWEVQDRGCAVIRRVVRRKNGHGEGINVDGRRGGKERSSLVLCG